MKDTYTDKTILREVLTGFGFDDFMMGQIIAGVRIEERKKGLNTMPNMFENNEPQPNDAEDHEAAGDGPHLLLPALDHGYHYEVAKLPSGRNVVKVVEAADETHQQTPSCRCGKYQSCDKCRKYVGEEDLNSPESRTLRHKD